MYTQQEISTSLTETTAPTDEPITVAEAKEQLRIRSGYTADDTYLDSIIQSVRRYLQKVTGRVLTVGSWTFRLDRFPTRANPITLPLFPVQSITAIKYLDADGDEQTWTSSEYNADLNSEPARIQPAFDFTYPVTRTHDFEGVRVEFVAGYGVLGTHAVAEDHKLIVKMLVTHWYQFREPVVADGTVPKNVQDHMHALLNVDNPVAFG